MRASTGRSSSPSPLLFATLTHFSGLSWTFLYMPEKCPPWACKIEKEENKSQNTEKRIWGSSFPIKVYPYVYTCEDMTNLDIKCSIIGFILHKLPQLKLGNYNPTSITCLIYFFWKNVKYSYKSQYCHLLFIIFFEKSILPLWWVKELKKVCCRL